MNETSDVKKKQHYVPEMMLRAFCIPNSNRVWEYNLHSGFITKKNISEICAERYLYELRDDVGFVNPNTTNLLENEFCKIEGEFTNFFNFFLKISKEKMSILLKMILAKNCVFGYHFLLLEILL